MNAGLHSRSSKRWEKESLPNCKRTYAPAIVRREGEEGEGLRGHWWMSCLLTDKNNSIGKSIITVQPQKEAHVVSEAGHVGPVA